MNPKETAKQLFIKMLYHIKDEELAIECAIIAVNEVYANTYVFDDKKGSNERDFWAQVRKEIIDIKTN